MTVLILQNTFSNFIVVPGLSKGSDLFMASSCGQYAGVVIVCPGPVPCDGKYKRSCQKKRAFDSPEEGHPRKKLKILCFLHIVLAFLIQRDRVRMLTRSSYLQLIFYVLGQENSQVLYLLQHVRRKNCVFFKMKTIMFKPSSSMQNNTKQKKTLR